jgi:hypothetical protein
MHGVFWSPGGALRFSGVSTSGWGLAIMSEYPFVTADNAEGEEKAFFFQAGVLFSDLVTGLPLI